MTRDYLGMLANLLPPGPAWGVDVRRDERSRVTGNHWALLLDALARCLQRLDDRLDALIAESMPITAKQTLGARYDEAGLPFGCLPRADNPDQMRAEVLYSWAALGGASPAYFAFILSKLDIPFRIREFRPLRVGMAVGELPLYGDEWAHWWQVSAVDTSYRHFRAGNSTAGEPLQSWGAQAIVCLINVLKPAHTQVVFRFVLDEAELAWDYDDFGADGLLLDDDDAVILDDDNNPIYWAQ
jgi:uncharacterized protein YmfQ (DUF2313 family)